MRCPSTLLVCLTLAVVFAACGGARGPYGLIADTDGSMLGTQNPDNVRRVHSNRLSERFDERLNAGGTVLARIDTAPIWDWDPDDATWYYENATVSLHADAATQAGINKSAYETVVGDFMRNHGGAQAYRLVWSEAPAETFRAHDSTLRAGTSSEPESTPVVPATPTPPAGRPQIYTVRAGDTLAAISAAFYGTPDRWRDLAEANDLDPAALAPGMQLRIPE